MATAREDAIANTGSFHPKGDAIHNMECALDPHLRSYCCIRSGRVKGTGYGTRHVTYSPNSPFYLKAKTLWNATASVVADLFQFLKEFHSVLALETAVHEATLNRLGRFGQPDSSDTKVGFSEFFFVTLLPANTYDIVGTDAADDSRTNTKGSVDQTPWSGQGGRDCRGEDRIAGSQ